MTYLKLFSTPKSIFFSDNLKLLYKENLGNAHGMEQDIDSILRWSYINYINFNLLKCQYKDFNIKSRLSPVLSQWSLEQLRTVEDHGIAMSNSLTWKEHVELRTRKVNKFFHQIERKTSSLMTVTAKLNLYKSTLIPILIYGSNCYKPSKSDMRLLEKPQKKFRNGSYQTLFIANN